MLAAQAKRVVATILTLEVLANNSAWLTVIASNASDHLPAHENTGVGIRPQIEHFRSATTAAMPRDVFDAGVAKSQ